MRSQPFTDLPAVRKGRVFDLGWVFVNSGWFGANWQMRQVATAFGLTQLRAGHHTAAGGASLVVGRDSGLVTIAGAGTSVRGTLVGPELLVGIEPDPAETVARIAIPAEAAHRLCVRPEDYEIRLPDMGVFRLEYDPESALECLSTKHTADRSWSTKSSSQATPLFPR